MKLTTKMRYGTRAMLDLALHSDAGPISLKEIASRQEVSLKYMEHLLATLQAAGLVRSTRGAHGGYVLARPATEIDLRHLYDALEGSEGFADCSDDPEMCTRADACVTRDVWTQMHAACMQVLHSTTLDALARRARETRETATMYHI